MVYKSEDKHLKISVRIFLDDLEAGISPMIMDKPYDISDSSRWDETQSAIRAYLGENLKIFIGGKEIEVTYLGSEIEIDAMWCYVEALKVKPFDEITVQYTALKEVFDDQENLVHVRRDGKVRSARIYGDKLKETLSWD